MYLQKFFTKSVLEGKTVHLEETKIQAGAFGPGLWRKFLPRRYSIPGKIENYRVWPLPWMMYL